MERNMRNITKSNIGHADVADCETQARPQRKANRAAAEVKDQAALVSTLKAVWPSECLLVDETCRLGLSDPADLRFPCEMFAVLRVGKGKRRLPSGAPK